MLKIVEERMEKTKHLELQDGQYGLLILSKLEFIEQSALIIGDWPTINAA